MRGRTYQEAWQRALATIFLQDAEIERLQASCVEYRAELSDQDATIPRLQARVAELEGVVIEMTQNAKLAQAVITLLGASSEAEDARDQRREQLLREVAAFMDDGMGPPDWSWHETLSARIRAELGDAK